MAQYYIVTSKVQDSLFANLYVNTLIRSKILNGKVQIHHSHSRVTPEHGIRSQDVKVSVIYSPAFKMLQEQVV